MSRTHREAAGTGCYQVIANWWCARSVRAAWRVAGTSGPLHQPLAAVEAGNKAGGLIAVGPGGLQVRAGRTDFEDAAEGGMANACSCRRQNPRQVSITGLVAASTDSGACTTARSDEKVSFPERAGLPRPSTRSLLIGKSRFAPSDRLAY